MMIDAVIGLGGFRSHATVAVSSAGELVAACPLERLTRVRGLGFRDAIWPSEAIAANLHAAGVPRDVMPDVLAAGPEFALFDGRTCRTVDHHNAHAASAFFTSPFERAAVIVCDTSGQEVSVWRGLRHDLGKQDFPWRGAGFARLYSDLAARLGASSGQERLVEDLARLIPDTLDDAALPLVRYRDHSLMVSPKLAERVDARPEATVARSEAARVILQTIGHAFLDFLADVRASIDEPNLCVAGGLFHNAYLNALVAQSPHFERTFVPVSCGNGGLAAGAALLGMARRQAVPAAASSPFLGPGYGNGDIKVVLENCKLTYTALDDERLIDAVVSELQSGRLVAWFRDRMEWGPRALGNRSIFADPLSEYASENLNRFLKQRPSYRSYGLVVCDEDVATYFEGPPRSPHMECEYRVRDPRLFRGILPRGADRLRVQTVGAESTALRSLLRTFGQLTGVPVLVNTSLNGFHEPIACTPRDAVRIFYGTGLDAMAIGSFWLTK
jgi:carbamoyltransferase